MQVLLFTVSLSFIQAKVVSPHCYHPSVGGHLWFKMSNV